MIAWRAGQRILFQGDSITDAFRRPEEVGSSYRLGAGYAMIVAARLGAEAPGLGLTFENRGVSGRSLSAMRAKEEEETLAFAPDVLSLLIGVNDTLQARERGEPVGEGAETFAASYRAMLEKVRSRFPGIQLVLLEPFLLPCGKITSEHLADLAPRQAALPAIARDFGATFVPLQRRLEAASEAGGPAYWLFDGIHPHAPAQWLIASAWLEAAGLPAEAGRGMEEEGKR